MFTRSITKAVTLSGLGAATVYSSTDLNGLLCGVYVGISKACPAAGRVVLTTSSTGKTILTVKPSTLGGFYYPLAQACGATGGLLASSAAPRQPIPIEWEKVRVKVASSSGLSGQTVTVRVWCY